MYTNNHKPLAVGVVVAIVLFLLLGDGSMSGGMMNREINKQEEWKDSWMISTLSVGIVSKSQKI